MQGELGLRLEMSLQQCYGLMAQISAFQVMKTLFVPSLISMLVPLFWFSSKSKGRYAHLKENLEEERAEPGAKLVFALGLAGLVFVPIFKAITGLPPFMGILLSFGVLWVATDIMHHKFDHRTHLRVPSILSKIDTSSIMFFLGILGVDALQTAGILSMFANFLDSAVGNLPAIGNSYRYLFCYR
jgi:Na+/H+ antiporter NhaD/arsenite permease-like protein